MMSSDEKMESPLREKEHSFNEVISFSENEIVISCCIPGCKSRIGETNKFGKPMAFHEFPVDDPVKLQKWVKFTQKKNFEPSLSRVCSQHFKIADFMTIVPAILKKQAVPSILAFEPPGCDPLQTIPKAEPKPKRPKAEPNPKRPKAKPLPKFPNVLPKSPAVEPSTYHPPFTWSPVKPSGNSEDSLRAGLTTDMPIPAPVQYKNKIIQTRDCSTKEPVLRVKRLEEQALKNKAKTQEMTKRIATLRKARSRLEAKLRKLSKTDNKKGFLEVFEFLEDSLQDLPILPLLKNHFSTLGVDVTKRKYSREMKEFAIVLYSRSRAAYKYMEGFLNLPKLQVVKEWVLKVDHDSSILVGDEDLERDEERVVPNVDHELIKKYPSHIFPISD